VRSSGGHDRASSGPVGRPRSASLARRRRPEELEALDDEVNPARRRRPPPLLRRRHVAWTRRGRGVYSPPSKLRNARVYASSAARPRLVSATVVLDAAPLPVFWLLT
jgi:hypothetical protein